MTPVLLQSESPAPAEAAALLTELGARPTMMAIAAAARALLPHRAALAAVPVRLGCLASFTLDAARTAIELQALRAGINLETHFSPFGRAMQELLDPASGLAEFKPDVVLLAVRLRDDCPAIYDAFNGLSADAANRAVDDWLAGMRGALRAFRARSAARVLLSNCEQPEWSALGLADATAAHSQTALIRRANEGLAAICREIANAFLMDYDALVALHGRANWADRRLALVARMAIAPTNYWALAGFYVRHLRPLVGLTRKVLVLDADNTLWGGAIGDVGVEGIELGPDYPGNAYLALHRRVLDLRGRGVVLCIASKNEPGVVADALARHPASLLRPEHFAAIVDNWSPKSDNLRKLAGDLNLGIDSFVFVDDSPVECGLMRAALPQVLTVQLQADPSGHAAAVEALDCFDQWTISEEDRQRGALYRAESARRQLQAEAVDLPGFYRGLAMRMSLFVDDPMQTARVAQMTQRTNQFNMHPVRCSEDDIKGYVSSSAHHVIAASLADRFGDNGVVGAAVVERGDDAWTLRLFLMSCRILGRTAEQCFIKWIGTMARKAGARRLVGLYQPTAKNKPFGGFYGSCGLVATEKDGDVQRWAWELDQADLSLPDWMAIDAPNLPR